MRGRIKKIPGSNTIKRECFFQKMFPQSNRGSLKEPYSVNSRKFNSDKQKQLVIVIS